MKLKRITIYILFCFAILQNAEAQDIHFSNFYTNKLNLNPAETGSFTGKYRFGLTYRNQYRTVAKPYQTLSFGFDGKISNRYMKSIFGYGLLLNLDASGDANYTTMQFGIPLAHHIPLAQKTVILSYGILPAIHYGSLDYSDLTFGEQFDGIQYNPDIEISEDIDMNDIVYLDLSAGLLVTYKPTKTQTYRIGAAFYNINRPKVSFYKEDGVRLRTRKIFYATANISVNQNIDIVPDVKMQFQGKQQEFHFGGMCITYIDNSIISQIQGGIWFRSKNKDAVIFGLGCVYSGFDVMLDYDLNISSLRTASDGHGAFELTVSTIIAERNRSRKMSAVRCPHNL